jgi:hypothetical protein
MADDLPDGDRQDLEALTGRRIDGRDDDPVRISTAKLALFCALAPVAGVSLLGFVISLQVAIGGDSSSAWPNGWSSVFWCALVFAVAGAGLARVIWTERERLSAAIRR